MLLIVLSFVTLFGQGIGAPTDRFLNKTQAQSQTIYDQRQSGKYNVHVNIKDVQLLSFEGNEFGSGLGDDVNYDYGEYDYDPAHLTVNPLIAMLGLTSTSRPPQKNSTQMPLTTTTTTTRKTTSKTTQNIVQITSRPPNSTKPTPTKPQMQAIYILRPNGTDKLEIEYEEIPFEVNGTTHARNKEASKRRLFPVLRKKDGKISRVAFVELPPSHLIDAEGVFVEGVDGYGIPWEEESLTGEEVAKPEVKPQPVVEAPQENSENQNVIPQSVAQVESVSSSQSPINLNLTRKPCGKNQRRDEYGRCRRRKSELEQLFRLVTFMNLFGRNNNASNNG